MKLLLFTISAEYGMISNVIIAIVLVFSLASCSFDRKIARETDEILHNAGVPDQEKWHEAFAEQYFTTEIPAFIWTVKLNMSPVIRIRGRDKFVNGMGEMQMKMYSFINLGKEPEAKRYEFTLNFISLSIIWAV